ncbi:hypothetical protein WJX81_003235 [Elliptochloris bilobata]|uniref:Trafficking protein particle complex subunit 11 domain-containing protein n=1 Tax=Elliptochloris bilobata TaxID=381761 RepID=A0AAW1S2H0_9CHLO
MEYYASEVVTPPLALVALLGCPALHGRVGEYLRAAQKPPINSLGVAEPSAAPRLFGERKPSSGASKGGILKVGWFAKHRQQRPAVAVLFLEREAAVGDPAAWTRILAALEAVRVATRPRGARTVIVVVQPPGEPPAELPEERLGPICRQGGIERRWVVGLSAAEGEAGLRRLARLLHEAAGAFYLDDARRRLAAHAERRAAPPELSACVAFKAAALAEFRADWATAVKTYQTAYAELCRAPRAGIAPLQRWAELCAVAELVHLKVVTLLLHQQRVGEALAQFRGHMGALQRPPLPLPPGAAAVHAGWLTRQYAVMGGLLATRVDPALLPRQRDARPAYFFVAAANAAIERRRGAARARDAAPATGALASAPALVPGPYVGQLVTRDGSPPGQRVLDAAYERHSAAAEAAMGAEHTARALARLQQAHDLVARDSGGRQGGLAYHLAALMAREHLIANDAAAARRLLDSVAGMYRRERWEVPLAAALLELRECAARLKLSKEHVTYSLELSAMRRCLDAAQRTAIAQAAVAALATAPGEPPGLAEPAAPLSFQVRPVNDSLLGVFALWAGFETCGGAGSAVDAPVSAEQLRFGVALWSNVPVELAEAAVQVVVADADGSFSVPAQPCQRPPAKLGTVDAAASISHEAAAAEAGGISAPGAAVAEEGVMMGSGNVGGAAEGGSDPKPDPEQLRLEPGRWARAWAAWRPRRAGTARVTEVVLRLGARAEVVWSLSAFPAGLVPIGWTGQEGDAQSPFGPAACASGAAVDGGRFEVHVPSRHRPPVLQIAGAAQVAVGEEVRLEIAGPEAAAPAVRLNALSAGAVWRGVALLRAERPGDLAVTAQLAYQSAPERGDPGAVTASWEATAAHPFELSVRVTAPARRALLLPPPPLLAAPSLDPGDVPPPGAAAPLGDAAQVGGSVSDPLVLPTGEPCLLAATLRAAALFEVHLERVTVEPLPGSGMEADPGEGVAATLAAGGPAALCPGDCHTALLRLARAAPAPAGPLGNVVVAWRRSRPPEQHTASSAAPSSPGAAQPLAARTFGSPTAELPPSASRAAVPASARTEGDMKRASRSSVAPTALGGDRLEGGSLPAGAADAEAGTGGPGAESGAELGSETRLGQVRTRLALPEAAWAAAALEAEPWWPPSVRAGEPFPLRLRLRNRTPLLLDVALRAGDSTGFVFAGPRSGSTALLPHAAAVLALELVAVSPGALPLPDLSLAVRRIGAALRPLAGRKVLVLPPAVRREGLAEAVMDAAVAQLQLEKLWSPTAHLAKVGPLTTPQQLYGLRHQRQNSPA